MKIITTPKFLALILDSISWCSDNITDKKHEKKLSVIKVEELKNIKEYFFPLHDKIKPYLDDLNKINDIARRFEKFNADMLTESEQGIILFCLREYLYFLEFERRKFHIDDEQMIDLSEDIHYCQEVLFYFEKMLDK